MRKFEWDERKAKSNIIRHGISFDEAKLIFLDPDHITNIDNRFEYHEERWYTIGIVRNTCLLLYVAHTILDSDTEVIRIISARRVNRKERKRYDNRKSY